MKLAENDLDDRVLFSIIYTFFTTILLFCSLSVLAEWSIKPNLRISETYTDNVRLGGGVGGGGGFGSEAGGSDFITQINPGVILTGENRRFDFQTSYRMNNILFAKNDNRNRIRHNLNSRVTVELLKDLFFIDGIASIRQQNATLTGIQTTDNANLAGNRANIRRYSASPYLRYRFQNFATTELRYTRGIVESGTNGLRNSQRDSYQFNLNSGASFRVLTWGLDYSQQDIHFDGNSTRSGRSIELERSIANLRYNITRRFGLTATGGYERNSFISIRGSPSSPTWTVGFIWKPNQRTDISASAGKRFFGNTYSGDLKYRTRFTTWGASYKEDITTFNQGGGGFGGGGAFSGGGFLSDSNFLSNRLFLQKRLQAFVSFNGRKNTLSFRVFNRSRKAFSSAEDDQELLGEDAQLLNNTRQTGANASWNYKFSPRTTANFRASIYRTKFMSAVDRKNDQKLFTADLTRRFQQHLRGMLQYRRIERNSNLSEDIKANSVTVSLGMNF